MGRQGISAEEAQALAIAFVERLDLKGWRYELVHLSKVPHREE
ncbi:hypothetical protein [Phenylobacterium sp.]